MNDGRADVRRRLSQRLRARECGCQQRFSRDVTGQRINQLSLAQHIRVSPELLAGSILEEELFGDDTTRQPSQRGELLEGGVTSLDVDSVEGRYIVCGASDATVRVLDAGSIRSAHLRFQEHTAERASCASSAVRDAPVTAQVPEVVVGAIMAFPRVRRRNGTSYEKGYNGHEFSVSCVQWYRVDSGMFFSGSFDGSVAIWDANEEVVAHRFRFENSHRLDRIEVEASLQQISRVHVLPYSTSATSNSWDPHRAGRTYSRLMRDSMTDARSHAVRARQSDFRGGAVSVASTCDKVFSLDCAYDGHLVVVGTSSHKVPLCDLRTGRASQNLLGHRDAVWSVKFSPHNQFVIASGSADRTARLWDIRRAGCLAVLDQHQDSAHAPEDSLVHPTTVRNEAATTHNGAVSGVVFTPDGRTLLTTGTDNHMRSWCAETGNCDHIHFEEVRNSANFATQLAVSTNSRIVYHPGRAKISSNEVNTGKRLEPLRGHHARSNCVAVNPLFEEMYSGGDDHQVLVWVPEEDNKRWRQRVARVHQSKSVYGIELTGGAPAVADSSEDDWDGQFDDL